MPDPPAPLRFGDEPLHEILPRVRAQLETYGVARLLVPDPDLGVGLYAGEGVPGGRHRPYQVWLDLADRLECHFLTPRPQGAQVLLTLRRDAGPAARQRERDAERYGADSQFQRIDKLEEPVFLQDMLEALGRVRLPPRARVLHVGVNSAQELRLLDLAYPGHALEVVGLDLSESALALARERFAQHRFVRMDVNELPRPELGRYDLIVCLATLQSPGVDRDRVFRALLREHLTPRGALILSLPNARYQDGRVSFGARSVNYRRPELSLLLADLALYRRYLNKHGFRVHVTGKYDLILTALPA